MEQRSLAAAQTVPTRGDVDLNLAQHIALAEAAARMRAQVVVFPELSLTGYELDLAERLAFSESDPRLAPLRETASSHGITLTVGAPVRIDGSLQIGAFVINGDSINLYTKHHLGAFGPSARADGEIPPAEHTVFRPGNRDPLVGIGGGTAAIAVCADTGRPSHAEQAAGRGARTYLASMFVIPSEFESEIESLRSCAVRHRMAVVAANHGGPTGGLASAGRSSIWSEDGRLLVRLEDAGAGVAVAIQSEEGWRAQAVMLGPG